MRAKNFRLKQEEKKKQLDFTMVTLLCLFALFSSAFVLQIIAYLHSCSEYAQTMLKRRKGRSINWEKDFCLFARMTKDAL